MTRRSRLKCLIASLAAVVAVAVTGAPAAAQGTPFKIRGGGVGPDGLPLPGQPARPHVATGTATHLGRYSGAGTLQALSAASTSPTTLGGLFGSAPTFTFTAANGDKLVCKYGKQTPADARTGQFTLTILDVTDAGELLVEALFEAYFEVQPQLSTGRLAGATGGWLMIARSAPFALGTDDPVYYSWEGTGRVALARP